LVHISSNGLQILKKNPQTGTFAGRKWVLKEWEGKGRLGWRLCSGHVCIPLGSGLLLLVGGHASRWVPYPRLLDGKKGYALAKTFDSIKFAREYHTATVVPSSSPCKDKRHTIRVFLLCGYCYADIENDVHILLIKRKRQ
jgi:hypothetical protein